MQQINTFPGYSIRLSHKKDGDMRDESREREVIRPFQQAHGITIGTYKDGMKTMFRNIDGIYTQEKEVYIGAMGADCPVILLMGNGEIAAVHSGWRGTRSHIVLEALGFFTKTKRQDIKVYIGPHIRTDSYEVREDFLPNFPEKYFKKKREKIFFDIEAYIRDDLLGFGIKNDHISSHGGDTFTNDRLFSYRREGMVGVGYVAIKMHKK